MDNNNKKFGVELDLTTQSFMKKLEEVSNKAKSVGGNIKNNFLAGFRIGADTSEIDAKLDELQAKAVNIGKNGGINIPINFDKNYNLMNPEETYNKLDFFPDGSKTKELQEIIAEINNLKAELDASSSAAGQLGDFASEVADRFNEAKQEAQEMKDAIKDAGGGSVAKGLFSKGAGMLGSGLGAVGNTIKKGASGIFGLASKGIGSFLNKGKDIKSVIGGSFDKSIGSVKRFALSLVGIRTIWSFITSQAKNYISQNEELQAKTQVMSAGFQQLLAPAINAVVSALSYAMSYVAAFIKMFTGVDIIAKGMKSVADSSKKTASGMGSAAKGANSLKGSLSGLDEVTNIAQDDDSSSSGGGSGVDLSKAKFPTVDVSNFDFANLGTDIAKKLNEAMDKIPWDSIKKKAQDIGVKFASFFNNFNKEFHWDALGNTIAQGFNTALNLAYGFVSTFDFRQFGAGIGQLFYNSLHNIDWVMLGQTVSLGLEGIFDSVSGFFQNVDWGQLARDIEKGLASIDYAGIAQSFFESLGSALGGLASFVGQIIVDAWTGIKSYFKTWIDNAKEQGGNVIDGLLLGIGNAILDIGKWIWDNIFKPFIDGFEKAFDIHSPSKVMEEQGNFIMEGLFNGMSALIDKIVEIFTTIKDGIKEKIKEIKNKISEKVEDIKKDWSEKWNTVKETTKVTWDYIGDNVSTKISNVKESISNKVQEIKDNWSAKWDEIGTKVVNVWDTMKANVGEKIESFKEKVGEKVDKVKERIKGALNLASSAKTWAHDMMDGFRKGIDEKIEWVKKGANNIANAIKKILHFSTPDEGPLKDYMTWMPDMVKGLSDSLNDSTPRLIKVTDSIADKMSASLNNYSIPNYAGGLSTNGNITRSSNNDINPNEETNSLLRDLIDVIENKSTDAYLDGKKITDTVISNIHSRERIMGRSVI